MSDPQTTGPDDDEELGHGGVEVPTDGIDDVPQTSDEEGIAGGAVGGGDGPGGSDLLRRAADLRGEPDETL